MIHLYEVSRIDKLVETVSRLVRVSGWGDSTFYCVNFVYSTKLYLVFIFAYGEISGRTLTCSYF